MTLYALAPYDTLAGRVVCREHPVFTDFDAAEKAGRRNTKNGRGFDTVWSVKLGVGQTRKGEPLLRFAERAATFSYDGFGRLWTDLTYEGAPLIPATAIPKQVAS